MGVRVRDYAGDGVHHAVYQVLDLFCGFGMRHFHCGDVEVFWGHEPKVWESMLVCG